MVVVMLISWAGIPVRWVHYNVSGMWLCCTPIEHFSIKLKIPYGAR